MHIIHRHLFALGLAGLSNWPKPTGSDFPEINGIYFRVSSGPIECEDINNLCFNYSVCFCGVILRSKEAAKGL